MLDTKTGLKKEGASEAAMLGASISNTDELEKRIKKAHKIIYFTDNSGEVIFDRILMEQIRTISTANLSSWREHSLYLMMLRHPKQKSMGLGDVAKIMENGIQEPLAGTTLSKTSKEIQNLVRQAGVIITKGCWKPRHHDRRGELPGKNLLPLPWEVSTVMQRSKRTFGFTRGTQVLSISNIIAAQLEDLRMSICVGHSRKHVPFSFQRLHSLAFRHGTFAYAKDQASLSSRRFAQENPTPCT